MPDKRISELTELTTPADGDILAIVDDPAGVPETKKITVSNLKSSIQDNVQTIVMDTTYTETGSESAGTLYWNSVDGTLDIKLNTDVVLQVGQILHFYGKASGAIGNGELCQFAGVQGDHILIKKVVASEIIANPEYLVGVATQDIANGDFGYITWFGKVNDVYTNTPNNGDSVNWSAGDILYFDNTTGQLTNVAPTAPDLKIIVASVIKAQTGTDENGILLVRPTVTPKLSNLSDVDNTGLADGNYLAWDNTNSKWVATAPTSTTTVITREVPTGTINGTNVTFTLANTPLLGTENIYLNGVLQNLGASNDYTISGATITFNTAPQTGDVLLVNYATGDSLYAGGSTSFVTNETPTGLVNGTNTVFDTANNYVGGTLQVFRDGQLMKGGGDDYTETDSNTFTFTTAPLTGSVLLVSYQQSVTVTGNADTVDGFNASSTPTANTLLALDSDSLLPSSAINPIHQIYAPEGFLINGKIVPSVASDDLTVALKTLAGNDPSASDPIYVRLDDTIRTITSALSVTASAGTNWFNAGGTAVATKEVDYFVYLGYNSTDGVVIGFARIPFVEKYGSFNATTDNEKYAKISTITNATSDDYYSVIGRFTATLSAGAGYTWTVPTFTASNLIQRPIYQSRRMQYVPEMTIVAPMTLVSTSTPSGYYQIIGSTYNVSGSILQAKSGTAGTYNVFISTPLPGNTTLNVPCGFASIDNKFGEVGLFGGTTTKTLQFRSATNMSADSVARYAYWGAIGVNIE